MRVLLECGYTAADTDNVPYCGLYDVCATDVVL